MSEGPDVPALVRVTDQEIAVLFGLGHQGGAVLSQFGKNSAVFGDHFDQLLQRLLSGLAHVGRAARIRDGAFGAAKGLAALRNLSVYLGKSHKCRPSSVG